jgi:hypothetical protein
MPQAGDAFRVLKDNRSSNRYKKITIVPTLKACVLNLVAVQSVRIVVFHVILGKILEALWHSIPAVYSQFSGSTGRRNNCHLYGTRENTRNIMEQYTKYFYSQTV